MTVVTTVRPLALIIQDLAPADIKVNSLLSATDSPHHYALKVSDIAQIKQADLVVWVGQRFETFIQKPIQQHVSEAKLITLMTPDKHEKTSHKGHNHDEDAHIWLNSSQAIEIAQRIAEKLVFIYPQHAAETRQNLARFEQELNVAQADILIGVHPVKRFGFAVYHDAYSAFVSEYKLRQLAHVTLVPEEQVSLNDLAKLKQSLVDAKCLIADTAERNQADKLAAKLDLPVVTVDLQASNPQLVSFADYYREVARSFTDCISLSN